jgi:ATP/maltotriose-dependent transcriptional regulator MalT
MLDRVVDSDSAADSYVSTATALLGEHRLRCGEVDDARRLALLSRDSCLAGDQASIQEWCTLLAKVEAQQGRLTVARGLAEQAVTAAEQTDMILTRVSALEGRAGVLVADGDRSNARADLDRALHLLESKGDRPGARRLRAELADLDAASSGARRTTGTARVAK